MKKMILKSSFAIVCGLVLSANVAHAATFTNGSFEMASVNPGGGWTTLGSGSTAITGWTVHGTVDYMGTYWDASDGIHDIDLNGYTGMGGGVSQTFDTTIGALYKVLFDISGNYAGPPTTKSLWVSAAGNTANYSVDITGNSAHNMNYATHLFSFVASSSSTTLDFTSSTDHCCWGPVLDNVRVTEVGHQSPVPEPETYAMLLAGLGLLGVAGRRRNGVSG